MKRFFIAALCLPLVSTTCAHAAVSDLSGWTLVEDPPHAFFSASATASEATLSATGGPIPIGTDIGYQSIDGNTTTTSSAGYAFSPLADFAVAIDFDLSFTSASGALGLGFGIGEDGNGENSAGAALVALNGGPFLNFFGAARVNDVTLSPQFTGLGVSLTGSLFATYDAASGDITLGASQSQSAASPAATTVFSGLQTQWAGTGLLTSFFIRSDDVPIFAPNGWTGGSAQAVFSNMRVLSGTPVPMASSTPGDLDLDGDVDVADLLALQRTGDPAALAAWKTNFGTGSPPPITAIPEPSALALLALAGLLVRRMTRRGIG